MSKRLKTGNGKTGRPISFNEDAAPEAAMLLFWERGFEGTSMADLTQAMGLNPSSIYAAFGDKHALFDHAVRRYLGSRAQYAVKALEEPTLDRVVRALFDNTVAFLTTPGHPPTCMTLAGAMGCSLEAAPARDLMMEVRKAKRSRHQRTPACGAESRRVVEGHQCGRLHSLSFIIARRPVHPGSKRLKQGISKANGPNGTPISGSLRIREHQPSAIGTVPQKSCV